MTSAIYFVQECPTCGRRLQIRVEDLGRRVVCQHCQGRFLAVDPASATKSIAALLEFFDAYRQTAGLPQTLGELNIPSPQLELLAEEAATQWTARFNPRPVAAADFVELYRAVLGGRQTVENTR